MHSVCVGQKSPRSDEMLPHRKRSKDSVQRTAGTHGGRNRTAFWRKAHPGRFFKDELELGGGAGAEEERPNAEHRGHKCGGEEKGAAGTSVESCRNVKCKPRRGDGPRRKGETALCLAVLWFGGRGVEGEFDASWMETARPGRRLLI